MFGLSCAHGIFIASRDLSLRYTVSLLPKNAGLAVLKHVGS